MAVNAQFVEQRNLQKRCKLEPSIQTFVQNKLQGFVYKVLMMSVYRDV